MDGTSVASINGALEKARSAAQIRKPTHELQAKIDDGCPSYLAIHWITSLSGGVPIFVDGIVIGAVAASGVRGDEDLHVAQAGVDAFNLQLGIAAAVPHDG
jgi:glc operon protein GlcG